MKKTALFAAAVCAAIAARSETIFLECERFGNLGGWSVDSQFIDEMGSSYLLAHGLGKPVADAVTEVEIPEGGKYTLIETKNGKAILGECIKVKELYKAILPYDFIIAIYEPNISYMTRNQIRMLLWHELMHVGMGMKVGSFKLEPHDVEEFFEIADEHGMRWDEPGAKVPDITRIKSHE